MKAFTRSLCALFAFHAASLCAPPSSGVFNVKDYGAAGSGNAVETRAINMAIEAASAAGGGTVIVPAGTYLSGSIHLKSLVTLRLENGAAIVAVAVDPGLNYDQPEPSIDTVHQDFGHSHWHNALIWGDSLHDVCLLGPGSIVGTGLVRDRVPGGKTADKAISLRRCRNVIIRDVTISHGGWFAILATGVDNFTVDNLKIDSNRDGIDIDCCANVRVSNCTINTPFDDGLCLKSSFALGFARPTQNVTITNCQLSGYDEGTLLDGTCARSTGRRPHARPTGRIKFGTESNGGFKNITISNCVFDNCKGIALETVDGGDLEDVAITNITMRDVVSDPIFLRLGARMRGPKGVPIGAMRRITISHIRAYSVDSLCACTISGLPGHEVEDVRLSDIAVYYMGGGTVEQARREIPEEEAKYPEPGMFGIVPAYGLFIRHARDVRIRDVRFSLMNPDSRPAVALDDVQDVDFQSFEAERSDGSAMMMLRNVSGFSISHSPGVADQAIDTAKAKSL